MNYLVFIDSTVTGIYQQQVNSLLGYPETIADVTYVGSGAHAPLGLGLATNYADVLIDQTLTRFALPYVAQLAIPAGATLVSDLPSDWYPANPSI